MAYHPLVTPGKLFEYSLASLPSLTRNGLVEVAKLDYEDVPSRPVSKDRYSGTLPQSVAEFGFGPGVFSMTPVSTDLYFHILATSSLPVEPEVR